MRAAHKHSLVALTILLLTGPACAPAGEPPSSSQSEPSRAEVMSSPEVQSALAGAMQMLMHMDKGKGKGKAKGNDQHKSPQRHPRGHNNAAQSDAARDAVSVARQAFGYAASHPHASQEDLKAQADAMMSSIFSRELGGAGSSQAKPQSSGQAKDYGDESDDDGGH